MWVGWSHELGSGLQQTVSPQFTTEYVAHAAFSWLAFALTALLVAAALAPFVKRVVATPASAEARRAPAASFPWWGWLAVAWLAVVNTALAFTLWNHTLRRLTAIESSLINNTMLVQIAILAWLFLGEPIGAREGLGLLVALAGTVLVQLPAARSASPVAPRSPPQHPDR